MIQEMKEEEKEQDSATREHETYYLTKPAVPLPQKTWRTLKSRYIVGRKSVPTYTYPCTRSSRPWAVSFWENNVVLRW